MNKMPLRYYSFVVLSLLPCLAHAADTYPVRPLRMVVNPTLVMIADIAKWAKVIKAEAIRGE